MTWWRDGVELKESSKYEMKMDGLSHTLIVKSAETKDGGTYSCQTPDDKMEFKVQVKGSQCILCLHELLRMFDLVLTWNSFCHFRVSFEVCRSFEISHGGVGRNTLPDL